MIQKTLLLIILISTLAACGGNPLISQAQDCPVTTPSEQTAKLPSTVDYEGRFWYGTSALWTNLPSDGTWQGLPHDDAGYVQKAVFWSEGFEAISNPQPDLIVSGRRLDTTVPTFTFSDATHGWDETGNFMLMGISLPTEGCWEITAEYQETQLTYVVKVVP